VGESAEVTSCHDGASLLVSCRRGVCRLDHGAPCLCIASSATGQLRARYKCTEVSADPIWGAGFGMSSALDFCGDFPRTYKNCNAFSRSGLVDKKNQNPHVVRFCANFRIVPIVHTISTIAVFRQPGAVASVKISQTLIYATADGV
jgi:hypothetical protein